MKNTNICPKCNSKDIVRISGKAGAYGSGNYVQVGLKTYGVHRYLCCSCGYSEEWVDKEDLPQIKEKFAGK